ncbi:TetR/AcrR family transcriptional regulator [Roseovarius arcticus]|uniref:TetR/AcrR family transcriptional regulator n=1 Tax=Roseovarius arcticus TaxID=2547404 RepID=UPI0011103967|nr:TetR/AcrR family transcriptional regulator [Roseovarius arcticus]
MTAHPVPSRTPGRPRKFDESEALAAIMKLFWEKGYEATGLSDIIAATGLGKASLYATFGNKQAMYLRALAAFEVQMIDAGARTLGDGAAPAMDRIAAFLDAPIAARRDANDSAGCFLCNASVDRATLDPDTAKIVQRCYAKLGDALERALAQIMPQDEAQRRAKMVLAVYAGLRVMARSGMDIAALEQARDDALRSLGAT